MYLIGAGVDCLKAHKHRLSESYIKTCFNNYPEEHQSSQTYDSDNYSHKSFKKEEKF